MQRSLILKIFKYVQGGQFFMDTVYSNNSHISTVPCICDTTVVFQSLKVVVARSKIKFGEKTAYLLAL
jgi:uncharacterized protein YlzI (FlbEa/FlbD family)